MMATADEITGDWSNVKGTHYHLLYALWLLIRNEGANLYFYEGNDLLARFTLPSPIVPPNPTSLLETEEEPTIALHAERASRDIWIQLKSTKSTWSCSRLLEQNLLINFICNGFQSEARNKNWRTLLITQGILSQGSVKNFVKSPQKNPVLYSRLKEILQLTRERLRKEGWSVSETKLSNLRRIAFEVLSQLSDSEPVVLETLKSDINAELTRAYPDQELVRQLEDTLIGALVRDASVEPTAAPVYDSEWINRAAGRPIVNRGMFDQDPVSACSSAIQSALEVEFEAKNFALRDRLRNALEQFMASNKTLFVLIGLSGSGKSWACGDWALQDLNGELRLLIPGHDMDHHRSLGELIERRLRPWTSAFWPPEQFLKRLADASKVKGRNPFTVIIDNLLPVGDPNVYRRDLAGLVAECKTHGFKIVLTCQRQLWELHQLGTDLSSNDVFAVSSEFSRSQASAEAYEHVHTTEKGQLHSFILSDFSPEEQTNALLKRLPADVAYRVANHFRLPGFTLLRSPYLMSRYLELNEKRLEEPGEPPPFNVHHLLDTHINSLLVRAASELSCLAEDIEPAFKALVERLWPDRQAGLQLNKAVESLATQFPERSFDLIIALRRVGLLTSGSPIRLADDRISDHLFAKRINTQLQEAPDQNLDELNPEIDSGVASAIIRDTMMDPMDLAERFLKINSKWAGAMARGLTQRSPDDWRTLALLTVFLESKEQHVVEAGYSGLGQLSARGERAWKWIAELYLGDHAKTWRRGSRALANAIEYFPDCVEAAIRTRLTRLIHIDDNFPMDRDKRKSWLLNGSLDPLRGVTHQSSAKMAKRVVRRYSRLTGKDQDWEFTNDLDHARGRIALFGPNSELKTVLAELRSDDDETRYRAAFALRVVAAERPASVKEALLTALVKESNSQVLRRLLLISFHLIGLYSAELLAAIKNSKAGKLTKPLASTGITLSLLGNLASKNTSAVESLLPSKLEKHPLWARAFSTEMFAYAWWRCAETSFSAKQVLRDISNPTITNVDKKYVPFALRGSAIALLGLMSVEQGLHSDELTGRQVFYPQQQRQFLYLETGEFFKSNVKTLIEHDDFTRFVDLLVQSVIKEETAQVYFHPVKEALYRCASMCIELLAQTAGVLDDPLPLLNRLPRNWQAIRAATRLLEMRRYDESIVNFARESFAGLKAGGTMQALEERRQCQAQLALLDPDSTSSMNEQRESAVNSGFLQSEGNSLGIAVLAVEQPQNLFSYVEDNVQNEHDLPTLYYLLEEARSWPMLLVARLYSRMFSSRPIGCHEASDLCEQMLAAVRSIPHSSIHDEYQTVYLNIYELLQGRKIKAESTHYRVPERKTLISKTHELSFELLTEAVKSVSQQNPKTRFQSFLYDERGWLETGLYELRDNLLLQGTSYMMYFFPAVRLSLVATASQLGIVDPAGTLMKERSETTKLIGAHRHILRETRIDEEDMGHAASALAELQKREILTPDDERLPDAIGTLLLAMNRLGEAETSFKRSLSRPLSRGETRAHTLKNLACVYALINDESACRIALEEAALIEPLDQKWLREDTDLEMVRSMDWFKGLTDNAYC